MKPTCVVCGRSANQKLTQVNPELFKNVEELNKYLNGEMELDSKNLFYVFLCDHHKATNNDICSAGGEKIETV